MCTVEKRGNLFILTLTGGGNDAEHHLTPTAIATIRAAVADVKSQALASPTVTTALITTAEGKFFSNGFDLRWVMAGGGGGESFDSRLRHMLYLFKPVVADFLSLPMPTIAAVNGHAAAAGFVLAISHDYVVMRGDKGVLYMSEIDNGMIFPQYFNVIFKEKVASAAARREIMLRGRKLKAAEAASFGIVDEVGANAEEVVEKGVKLGEELVRRKWHGEIYGEIRKGLYPELCKELGLSSRAMVIPRL